MGKEIRRAVIVEDSPGMRKLIHMVLEALGTTEIVEAEDGAQALKALQASPTDVVVMDWNMDVMDGLECTRRIRAGVEGIPQGLPIILLTGNTSAEAEAVAYEAGVDLFMAKPFSMRNLMGGMTKVFAKER